MNIKTLEERLLALDGEIQDIFKEIGYEKKFEITNLEFDKENLDDCMMYKEFSSICSHLDYIHAVLSYLQKPVTNMGIIHTNNDGVYELDGAVLKKDDVVEIVCMDEDEKRLYWYPIQISDRKNLDGENARIRGLMKHINSDEMEVDS